MTRTEIRRYAAKLAADDWERSRPVEPCEQLGRELDAFFDDPITIAYGVGGECSPLVIAAHKERHVGCPGLDPW